MNELLGMLLFDVTEKLIKERRNGKYTKWQKLEMASMEMKSIRINK